MNTLTPCHDPGGSRIRRGAGTLLALWLALAAPSVRAASVAWVGPATGNHLWSSPSNWQGGRVPGAADDVVIQGEGLNLVVRISGNFSIQSLDSTATLRLVSDLGANTQLAIAGRFLNRGTFTLESDRSDRASTLNVTGTAGIDNRGLIRAIAANGGGRRLNGALANRGRLEVETGIDLVLGNADRTLALLDGQVEASGSLGVLGGRVEVSGGQLGGDIRLFSSTVRVDDSFTSPGLLRMLGAQSLLQANASRSMVLRLDTDLGNNTTVTTLPGAINGGRIILGSARSDRSVRFALSAGGFTNGPSGVIEVLPDGGGGRDISGYLVNQGVILATNYPVDLSGTYQADGGRAVGDVRGLSLLVRPTRPAPVSNELQLYGAGTVLEGNVLTNLILRVISDLGANAVLQLNLTTDLVNEGTIRLESTRSDRVTTLRGTAPRLVNRGRIQVLSTNGGERVIVGGLVNQGELLVEPGVTLAVRNDATRFSQEAGRLDVAGSLTIHGGVVEVSGGLVSGDVRLFGASTFVSAAATSALTLRILGTQSTLIGNASPASTLVLDTDGGNLTTLTTLRGAMNVGRIVLGSSRADRDSRLHVAAGFTNAPTGVILAQPGSGGSRFVSGLLVNQGALVADGIPLTYTGTYQSDGGRVAGDVRFASAQIAATRPTPVPQDLHLYGSGSTTLGWIITNLVLHVISDATANAVLTLDTNGVNQGTVMLESLRSDRLTSLRGADGIVRNGPSGVIVSDPANGGDRAVGSSLQNLGTVRLRHPLRIAATAGRHVNEGIIDLGGQTMVLQGQSFLNETRGRLLGAGEIDARTIALTNAGVLSPGAPVGRLVIRGTLNNAETGIVGVEIAGGQGAGTGHDLVEILGGRAILTGGILPTRILGAYGPAAETRFRVLSAEQGVTGRFSKTPSLQVLPNRYLQTEYLPNAIDLRALTGVDSTLPPSIILDPEDQAVEEQANAEFAVSANGSGPFTYQWRRNGVPIPGATSNRLALPKVLASDFAEYDVVVSNAAGSSTSRTARLNQKSTGQGEALDYGDAEDPPQSPRYPTTAAHNGASQHILPGFHLGASIDADDGTQQNAAATADGADEDGVTFPDPFRQGQAVHVQVVYNRPAGQANGRLSAWVDWNGNGSWAEAGERIINNVILTQRTNTFLVGVPSNAKLGFTASRFRLYADQDPGFSGPSAEAGEVEDYRIEILDPNGGGGGGGGEGTHDFGDAPDSYRTLLASDGARHLRDPELRLGVNLDLEADGHPSALGLGDDLAGPPDDEDGVTGSPFLTPGGTATLQVTVTGTGRVDAWIDFDRDGTFGQSGERVLTGMVFNNETRTLTLSVPATAVAGGTFARFRLSRQGVNSWFGPAPDGEVEDYPVVILAPKKDWGDAPDGYPTLLRDDGARHTVAQGFHLGKSLDAEDDGHPNVTATGDDLSPQGAADDEDGVTFSTPLIPGQSAEVRVEASAPGRLDAWIDFGPDPGWGQPGDRIFTGQALVAGINVLSFNVPATAKTGRTFARFRLSRNGVNTFTGDGSDGEVEDHRLVIEQDQGCQLGCSGRDFWIAFPGNYAPDPANPVEPRLRVSGTAGTTVTVAIPGLGTNLTATLSGSGATFLLPSAVDLGDLNDAVLPRGIHITATAPVRVHAISQADHTSDGFLALPTEVLTGEYVVAAYRNTQVGVPEISGSQWVVVATVPNTRVAVTPSFETGLRLAGVPYTVVLTNIGDCYQLRNTSDAPADLSGSLIEADQPVAVFGSHTCANVNSPSLFFCDYLVEQMLPTERLGAEFYVAPLATRSGGETVRVVAARDDTTLTMSGTNVVLEHRGDVHEVLLTAASKIVSDKPVQVTQLASSSDFDGVRNSDPFMVLVPSRVHFTTNHAFATGGTNFSTHHVSLVVPASLTSLTLNGTAITPGFTNIPASGYKYAHLTIPQGFHTLAATQPFGAIVYGWGEFRSYGWPSCFFFGDTTPPHLQVPTNHVTLRLDQVQSDIPCKLRVPDFRSFVRAEDSCGLPANPVITQDPEPGSFVGVGVHSVTLSTEDTRGNVGRTIVELEVVDPNPQGPVSLNCPGDLAVRCDDPSGAVVHYEVEALRGCTPIAVECRPPSGSRFPIGTTTVVCRITEPGVPVRQCSFQVTVDCSRPRKVTIKPPVRVPPAPGEPTPPTEVVVEWEQESGVVLEVSDNLRAWQEIPTSGNRHVIRVLQERGKFFRIRAR